MMQMDRPQQGVRPETLALGALIEATIERATANESKRRSDGLLFLSNRHVALPMLVVKDPVLEPVDKQVWMTILVQAEETGGYFEPVRIPVTGCCMSSTGFPVMEIRQRQSG